MGDCLGKEEREEDQTIQQKQAYQDILFLGITGSGKTKTFLQMSTPENNKIQKKKQHDFPSYCFDNDKRVIDSPSINLEDINEREQFAIKIQKFMEKNDRKKNRIIGLAIFVKFERTDMMKQNIIKIVSTFRDYNDLILIVVTNFELSENEEEDKRHLRDKFKLFFKNYQQEKIIFVKSQDNPQHIIKLLNQGIDQLNKELKFSLNGTIFCKITDEEYQQFVHMIKQSVQTQ